MARRKGEFNKRQLDSGWPHQVALASKLTTGKTHEALCAFCKELSLAPLGHVFVRDGEYINVWCFKIEEDARKFIERFGGEMIDRKNRPRWPGRG
jgi:hypothetical protein